jgi:hypothetical protein
MNSSQGRPFDLEPAGDPIIPPEITKSITDLVYVEAQEFLMQGQQIHAETFRTRMKEIHDIIRMRIKDEARQSAKRMGDVIDDQLTEGGWDHALVEYIDDYVTYPTAILKAPVVTRKKRMVWGQEYNPIVVNDFCREVKRVSPYNIYPAPHSMGPDKMFIIEKIPFHRADLVGMIGTPGYSDTELKRAIDHYGQSGLKFLEYGEAQKQRLDSGLVTYFGNGERIEALEYWGSVNGKMLREWGMKTKVDDYEDYEVTALLVGNYVVRCILNPDPLGRRPYKISSWGRIPGSFWGIGLPEIIRDVQIMCNAAARSLANNMAVASGPQVEVQVDRLPDGENVTQIYPWKIWQTTSDRTGSGQPAVRFYQPSMNAQELLGIYQSFSKQADEVSGIPNYVTGSTQQGGAGRTASGLSMLMDNAAKGIKMALVNIDEVVRGVVNQYYTHNMIFNPDKYIKGDFKIVSKGALGLIAKEQLAQRRAEFLQQTANPIDMQIIGNAGRSQVLREVAHGLQMNTDKIVPDEDYLKMEQGANQIPPEVQQQLQQAAEAMQQAQQALEQKDGEMAQLVQAINIEKTKNASRQAEVDARRYEADRRYDADTYRADKQAEAQAEAAKRAAEVPPPPPPPEPEVKMADVLKALKEMVKPPVVTVNSDNSAIAQAIKSSSESTAKIVSEVTKNMAQSNEVLAKAVEQIAKPKSASITLTKGKDGSVTGKKTEQ